MLLSLTEWGAPNGSPVICLHGVNGHRGRFRQLAQERLAGYRVIGVDARGHGRSTWQPPWSIEQHVADLIETAGHLGIGEAAWIGHSFGGRLVAEVAARHPDLVERAVLLDPAMHIDPAVAAERAELTRTDVSFADADEAIEARYADGSLFSTPREMLEEDAREHLVRGADGRYRWNACPGAVVVAWSEMSAAAPPWPRCPTLVVIGAQSWLPVVVPSRSSITRLDVPGGHGVLWDDYEPTASAIADFLR